MHTFIILFYIITFSLMKIDFDVLDYGMSRWCHLKKPITKLVLYKISGVGVTYNFKSILLITAILKYRQKTIVLFFYIQGVSILDRQCSVIENSRYLMNFDLGT